MTFRIAWAPFVLIGHDDRPIRNRLAFAAADAVVAGMEAIALPRIRDATPKRTGQLAASWRVHRLDTLIFFSVGFEYGYTLTNPRLWRIVEAVVDETWPQVWGNYATTAIAAAIRQDPAAFPGYEAVIQIFRGLARAFPFAGR